MRAACVLSHEAGELLEAALRLGVVLLLPAVRPRRRGGCVLRRAAVVSGLTAATAAAADAAPAQGRGDVDGAVAPRALRVAEPGRRVEELPPLELQIPEQAVGHLVGSQEIWHRLP